MAPAEDTGSAGAPADCGGGWVEDAGAGPREQPARPTAAKKTQTMADLK
jgi:hypothetical protein